MRGAGSAFRPQLSSLLHFPSSQVHHAQHRSGKRTQNCPEFGAQLLPALWTPSLPVGGTLLRTMTPISSWGYQGSDKFLSKLLLGVNSPD